MKILHTSDWHIGKRLYNQKRYEEFEHFLKWIEDLIIKESIDVLLICGDIFDTATPSNRSQNLYYDFLARTVKNSQVKIIVTGGNHDSPSFLNAPSKLLQKMGVFVIGSLKNNIEDELIIIKDKEDIPRLLICAIPYLRDKDIRSVEDTELYSEKNEKYVLGIKDHYMKVGDYTQMVKENIQKEYDVEVPVVATGHLFAAGSTTIKGDGVRELYVGNVSHVGTDIFHTVFDYVALGHIHISQKVGGKDNIRYCGSPLPMGFGECKMNKNVIIVQFDQSKKEQSLWENNIIIENVKVPVFQKMFYLKGDLNNIIKELDELKKYDQEVWVEIEYNGDSIIGDLKYKIDEHCLNSNIKVLKLKNKRFLQNVLHNQNNTEELKELKPGEVFQRCMDLNNIERSEQEELNLAYNEVIREL